MQLLKEHKQRLGNPQMHRDKEVLEHSINNLRVNNMEMFGGMGICVISINIVTQTVLTQVITVMRMATIKIVRIELMTQTQTTEAEYKGLRTAKLPKRIINVVNVAGVAITTCIRMKFSSKQLKGLQNGL